MELIPVSKQYIINFIWWLEMYQGRCSWYMYHEERQSASRGSDAESVTKERCEDIITDCVRSTRGGYIFSLFVCSHLGGYPIPGPGGVPHPADGGGVPWQGGPPGVPPIQV